MTTAAALDVAREFGAVVGEKYVIQQTGAVAIDGVQPVLAVAPGTAEEVAAAVRVAHEHGLQVVPAGGFTAQANGYTPARIDVLLDLRRLNQVTRYDPGDLTLSVQAGTTVGELQRTLGEHRQLFALDPPLASKMTIGGALATAAQGPLKHAYGGLRDFCIGIQFVTGDGKLAKGGGRVVKNVAGYDLMKLLIGSLGTLGVVVGANFKVFPAPVQTRTFVAEFGSAGQAIEFRDLVLRSALTPACLEIVSPRTSEYLQGSGSSVHWRVALRAGGSDRVLARYRKELGSVIARELEGAAEAALWRSISDFEATAVQRHQNAMVLHVSVPIAEVERALMSAEGVATDHNFLCAGIGRAGAGSLVIALLPIAVDPPSAMQYANAVSQLRGSLSPDASVVVLRCPREAKPHFDLWGASTSLLPVMRAVKQALDPKDILNRGRFVV